MKKMATKDEDWKKSEIARLKEEQGIAQLEEPQVNTYAGDFDLEVTEDESESGQ